MFKRTIVAVITFAALLCSAFAVNAATPKLSPDKSIRLVAEAYLFGTAQNSAAEKFLRTTLKEIQTDSATANQIKSTYAAKLKSSMSVQTKLKTKDANRPVVTVTTTPLNAAANTEELLALKVDARMGGTEYKNRVQKTVTNFINGLTFSRAPKSIDVVCTVYGDGNGNFIWVPEDYTALQNFLAPTIELKSNAEIDEFLGNIGGGFVYNSSTRPKTEPVKPQTKPESDENKIGGDNWLIYWYICGTNLESDNQQATNDLHEMQAVKLPSNVKVLIQTGTTSRWHHDIVNANGRYIYDSNGLNFDSAPFESTMYEPASLKSFLEYGREYEKTFKPAHRILIFWDHGGVAGILQDQEEGGTMNSLGLNDLRAVLEQVYPSPENPPFDLIAFDACEMASYECASTIYGFARYMVASEANESYQGFYYTSWLDELAKNPKISGGELGKIICTDSFGQNKRVGEEKAEYRTFSVIDMSQFENLRTAHENFFTAALKLNGIAQIDAIARYSGTENYNNDFVDLMSLATNSQKLLPEADALINAIDDAVIHTSNGRFRIGGGVSTYYPYNSKWWEEFEKDNPAPPAQKLLYAQILSVQPIGTQMTVQDTSALPGRGSSNFNVASLMGLNLTLGKDNHVTAKLTPEQLKSVSRVGCLILMGVDFGNSEVGLEDEGAIVLGNNIAVKSDWQSGTFRDDFSPRWIKLDDHLISMEMTFRGNGYRLFEAPIRLNGKPCALQISYTESDNKYHVDGARKYTENGMASRDGLTVNVGDEITPLFMALVPPYATDADEGTILQRFENPTTGEVVAILKATEGKAFKLETLSVEEKPLDDEYTEFAYCFEFFAPDGTAAISQGVMFTVEDGKITDAELVTVKQIEVTAK